ncbi:MAG: hydantoinase B/oxoprolinase family protein [Actinomycetota bacterium]
MEPHEASPRDDTPPPADDRWQFWIDRGGTFTDIVARRPDGTLTSHKLLSEHPNRHEDAAIAGIRHLLDVADGAPLPSAQIGAVKMGTTVATNALLERRGEPTVLVTTRGFADALRIGYQNRPDLFALDIVLPEMLHRSVIEVAERVAADGTVLVPLDEAAARRDLAAAFEQGYRTVAIVLLHGYRHADHEARLAALAAEVGFTQISVSHRVSPLMKLVSRGDTTVVDAYLSPVLGRYVDQVASQLRPDRAAAAAHAEPEATPSPLLFMQSNGGLAAADRFQGKDALLSGPAGGVVGMVATATAAGHRQLIGFDMGGTSTDVAHYDGELERTYETELAGVRVRAPMMAIHTVAAGGGSVCHFDGGRLRVGPDSAGADPGPVCYGNGGPLAITDANVLLGRLQADFFPAVFGPGADQPLDVATVAVRFDELAARVTEETGRTTGAVELAEGFVTIAIDNMANAIKKISVQRGHDVSDYTLVCFGGAGGQHACGVADRLGMRRVLIHPYAGVLSALGIGLADVRVVLDEAVEAPLDPTSLAEADATLDKLEARGRQELDQQLGQAATTAHTERRLALRYQGSDTSLFVAAGPLAAVVERFEAVHRARFGFAGDRAILIESVQAEVVAPSSSSAELRAPDGGAEPAPLAHRPVVFGGRQHETPFLDRATLGRESVVAGPAVIVDAHGTTVVEPGWTAALDDRGNLDLVRVEARPSRPAVGTADADPIQLEIFNNLFMNVAEQMGVVLENTASSVNIKERLDFSCAIFDPDGELVANAPHMPVHLGSMSESIKSVIAHHTPAGADHPSRIEPGDAFVLNAPYNGGTHLPDVTVIKPVFGEPPADAPPDRPPPIIFYVASRGHHADVGGVAPGSAPAHSSTVEEEGVLLDNVRLMADGRFLLDDIRAALTAGPYPARNPDQNIADLQAQVAACEKGVQELGRVIDHYGLDVVHAYMRHVRDNAEESVRRLIESLDDAAFTYATDDGHQVSVAITVDRDTRSAVIDFTGTSGPHPGNFNAPRAVGQAAVLYVFRAMVDDDIPLNAGCLVPLRLIVPDPSMISPHYPSAVFAGNVETSQLIVDTLFGALGVMAASQGTMNNVLWGNDTHQYYETICGGAGATANGPGCDAVHTHMTNSRLTDPEVLEWRFPVTLEHFGLRAGSGGRGRHRGGDGVERRVRFNDDMTLNILSSHRVVAPYGMAGGEPGATGRNRVLRADGTVVELAGADGCEVRVGDVLEILTPGGGGYGPPPNADERDGEGDRAP